MKKLLLILLCVPLIGFGQDIDIDYGENTPDSILWNGGFDIRDRWYPPDSLCISGDCENGSGEYIFWVDGSVESAEAIYKGEFENGKLNGKGNIVCDLGGFEGDAAGAPGIGAQSVVVAGKATYGVFFLQ